MLKNRFQLFIKKHLKEKLYKDLKKQAESSSNSNNRKKKKIKTQLRKKLMVIEY